MSWSDDKELSIEVDAISRNYLKKKKNLIGVSQYNYSCYKFMTKTVQSPTHLQLNAFRNLKLAIIFKIFLLFYLLLNLIILSKNIYF